MRFAFALLAVMALLVSPVTAAVAQAGCGHNASATMHCPDMMAMPAVNGAAISGPGGDPCCDHGAKHGKAGCAQACAAACAVVIALAAPFKTIASASGQAEIPGLRATPLHPFEPQRLKRPPKSMG